MKDFCENNGFIVRYWLFRFCLFFCFFLSGSFIILQNNTVFWLLFSTLALSIALVVTFSFCSNVTCSIFSSFTIILPIDYWVGSSLKYVMINIVRRATVEDFNLAIVRPPVQTKGIIFLWTLLELYINYICTENMLMYIKCFETIFDTISDIWLIVFWICLAFYHFYKHYQNRLLSNRTMTETTPLWNQY